MRQDQAGWRAITSTRGLTTDERARFKQFERENVELRRANEILRPSVGVFREGGARPPSQVMVGFIDDHRETFRVEPICAVLPIAPSGYYELKARDRDPHRQPGRVRRDEAL
jgi:putative transposase